MVRQRRNHEIAIVIITWIAHAASAQEHLIPDPDALAKPNRYQLKRRHVFTESFDKNVILRAVILPSFKDECAALADGFGDYASGQIDFDTLRNLVENATKS